MNTTSSIKKLSLNELYDIFEMSQYDEFRADFSDDIFINRNNPTIPTIITGLLCLGGKVPLVYQHIVAERLFAKPFDDIDWQEMDAYHLMTLLSLVYLWMYPLAWTNIEGEEQIVVKGECVREVFDISRMEKVWEWANKLFEEGVFFFVDELPICTYDDIELGFIKNTHSWEYITANTLEVVGKILQEGLKRQERWEECRILHYKTLRYSIMLIKEQRGGEVAAAILKLLQKEWSTLKTWDAMGMNALSENEIQQFENCLFNGFTKDLEEWKTESNNVHVFEMSTERAIKVVYDANICDSADWAAVVKILEEQGKWPKSAYSYAADYINRVCDKKVTSASSISRSIIYTKVKGLFPKWEIKELEQSRETPNKLRKFLKIGEIFTQAQNT